MKAFRFWLFSVSFAVFFAGPALLAFPLPFFPLMKVGDAFDLWTPLVLIPLYWSLFVGAERDRPTVQGSVWFVILAALWVLGHGIHLAANSIGHQLAELQDSAAFRLTAFYDEGLGHYLWHLGIFGLTSMIMVRSRPAGTVAARGPRLLRLAASLIYGLTYFIIVVEGRTWPIGLPYAVLAGGLSFLLHGRDLGQRPALDYFAWSHLVGLVLLVGWWLRWGYLPEFSELGWI